jgi:hypothetical protein
MSKKYDVKLEQAKVLEELEKLIGKPIPQNVYNFNNITFGVKIEGDNIIGLGLYKMKLLTLPESIGNLPSLRELMLSENQLKKLPESVGNLKSLQDLDLGYNELTRLPVSIGNLSSLEELKLTENQLTKLPESIGHLKSLKRLRLENNELTTLPESIGNLKSLRELYLDENKVTKLPESIGNLESLKELKLFDNNLSILPESIGTLKLLQKLNLWGNKLTTLPDSLRNCKNLESLELRKNLWKGEWKEIEEYDCQKVLEMCRQKAPITIFISHSISDEKEYNVNNLKVRLKGKKEIREVYSSGENNVSDSQLLIFIATKNSITDTQSRHELGLALTHGIGIIPIKGTDIEFEDINQLDLKEEGHGYFDLGDKLGFEFDSKKTKLKKLCDELYEYIKLYKRDFNLFDVEERKINIERENVKTIIEELIESVEFRENLMENFTQLKAISEELRTEQIYPVEYILRWIQILNSKSK